MAEQSLNFVPILGAESPELLEQDQILVATEKPVLSDNSRTFLQDIDLTIAINKAQARNRIRVAEGDL